MVCVRTEREAHKSVHQTDHTFDQSTPFKLTTPCKFATYQFDIRPTFTH